jgi:hypothetical protein
MLIDCPLRVQGKSPAKCTKCERRWHPAEFCDRKAINAPSVSFAESTSAITEDVEDDVDHSDTVASLGSWSTYANKADKEVVNNVQLLSVLQLACIKDRVLSKYTKIIMDFGASISVIKTDFIDNIIPKWHDQLTPY